MEEVREVTDLVHAEFLMSELLTMVRRMRARVPNRRLTSALSPCKLEKVDHARRLCLLHGLLWPREERSKEPWKAWYPSLYSVALSIIAVVSLRTMRIPTQFL